MGQSDEAVTAELSSSIFLDAEPLEQWPPSMGDV